MAFEKRKTSQSLDRALGKPFAASTNPWVAASPQQNSLTELRKKAKTVQTGQGKFTRDEIQELLAGMILSGE